MNEEQAGRQDSGIEFEVDLDDPPFLESIVTFTIFQPRSAESTSGSSVN